jgi:hypothetical protein
MQQNADGAPVDVEIPGISRGIVDRDVRAGNASDLEQI